MEIFILYILPMIISWVFLALNKDGNAKSGGVIFMISIIPVLNIIGAIMAFETQCRVGKY